MSYEFFAADWLRLREPVDHRSRAHELTSLLVERWKDRDEDRGPAGHRVLDLGSGTGSNVRYLLDRMSRAGGPRTVHPAERGAIQWVLLDHDPDLLALAPGRTGLPPGWEHHFETIQGDVQSDGLRRIDEADLVTASALLDLVSESWLDGLVRACTDAAAAVLLALSYDGRIRWTPSHPLDAEMAAAVNTHQRRDKGTGPALGPTAASVAERAFARAGFSTRMLDSAWHLGPVDRALTFRLVAGWRDAWLEECPDDRKRIDRWARDRHGMVDDGQAFSLVVGHQDLLALPPAAV